MHHKLFRHTLLYSSYSYHFCIQAIPKAGEGDMLCPGPLHKKKPSAPIPPEGAASSSSDPITIVAFRGYVLYGKMKCDQNWRSR